MSRKNRYLAQEAAAITVPFDFATAADSGAANKDAVQLLIDAMELEGTDPTYHRLYLDEMSPAARTSLYACLVSLRDAVVNTV